MSIQDFSKFCEAPTYENFLELSPLYKKVAIKEAEQSILKKEKIKVFKEIYDFGIKYVHKFYLSLFNEGVKRIRKEIVNNIEHANNISVTFYAKERKPTKNKIERKETKNVIPVFQMICKVDKKSVPTIFYIDECFSFNRFYGEKGNNKKRITSVRSIGKKRFQQCFYFENLCLVIYKGASKKQETLYKKDKHFPKIFPVYQEMFLNFFGKSMGNYKYKKFADNVYKNVPMQMFIKNFDIFDEKEAEELKKDQKHTREKYSYFYELPESFTEQLSLNGRFFIGVKNKFEDTNFQRIITFSRDSENRIKEPEENVVILILSEFFVIIINNELEFIHRRKIEGNKEVIDEQFFYPKDENELDLIDLAYEYSFCSPYINGRNKSSM